ncbi:MAG: hypothetical protein KatS3mg002_1145 [Candidatus Woesearchaeota archaeon]|nr:MAG: hypothetical protein KatS3mg002_1145 [Candidatus Woesearchaeota archaeon]
MEKIFDEDIFDEEQDIENYKTHKRKSVIAVLNKEKLTKEELDELFIC